MQWGGHFHVSQPNSLADTTTHHLLILLCMYNNTLATITPHAHPTHSPHLPPSLLNCLCTPNQHMCVTASSPPPLPARGYNDNNKEMLLMAQCHQQHYNDDVNHVLTMHQWVWYSFMVGDKTTTTPQHPNHGDDNVLSTIHSTP